MKILVMSPEIRNPTHRGIYAYTKSLLTALKRLGHTTGLLTQAKDETGMPVLPTRVVNDLVFPHEFDCWAARESWMSAAYRRQAIEVSNAFRETLCEEKWSFLRSVDYFFNSPLLYDALEFRAEMSWLAPHDRAARANTMVKRWTGEFAAGALNIDYVGRAGYDLVITTSPHAVRSKTSRVRIVQTVHDIIPIEYPFMDGDPVLFLNDLTAGTMAAHRIIAVSDYTKLALNALVPETGSKTASVLQANPLESLRRKPALPNGTESNAPYFLYLGAIEQRKNIDTLLTAFSMIAPETGYKLVIAGGGHDEYLERIGLKALNATSNSAVSYLGVVSDERKIHLLQHARCFVFPSRSEGFGLPIVEAMSAGCPVITSGVTSLPEVGGDAVLYVNDPNNAAELAKVMCDVAQKLDLAADLRAKGLERSKLFSMEAFTERLQDWGRANEIF